MKFDELDGIMRRFEDAQDSQLTPETFVVARLDGRGFTRLTKELMDLSRPFDERFRDAMLATVERLMTCGFSVAYAHTQSDEVSVLVDKSESAFGRSSRKWISLLAAEASSVFTLKLGTPAAFDCRLILLPSIGRVVDYFRWRGEDAHRNSLSAWCYWQLREEGMNAKDATIALEGASVSEKNELLFQRGINFNDLPPWQRRGIAAQWEMFEKHGVNALSGEAGTSVRRRIRFDSDLPVKEEYSDYVRRAIEQWECDRLRIR